MHVDSKLKAFVEDKVLPSTGVGASTFWDGLRAILEELAPRNRALLQRRDTLQARIDAWHKANPGVTGDAYTNFLKSIGYLAEPAAPFSISTQNVDPEVARVAGPQLVCPVDNDRFIVNAANARWGSLLDAIYGTDVLEGDRAGPYSEQRGAAAFDVAHGILDEVFPLRGARWGEVTRLSVESDGDSAHLCASLASGHATTLTDPSQLAGYLPGVPTASSLLLANNGLHVELQVDRTHRIGATHAAGLKDIQMESALTAICDMEDSACAVDAEDKIVAYANWRAGTVGRPPNNRADSLKTAFTLGPTHSSRPPRRCPWAPLGQALPAAAACSSGAPSHVLYGSVPPAPGWPRIVDCGTVGRGSM